MDVINAIYIAHLICPSRSVGRFEFTLCWHLTIVNRRRTDSERRILYAIRSAERSLFLRRIIPIRKRRKIRNESRKLDRQELILEILLSIERPDVE